MQDVIGKIRRGLRRPPSYIVERLKLEARAEAERYWGPRRAQRFDLAALLWTTESESLEDLWTRLQEQDYVVPTSPVAREVYERICPGDCQRILDQAEDALAHRVNLLGSGPVDLGSRIDWHKDYKTGLSWPVEYFRNLDYLNPDRPSDVKLPWELSRMQWLIPAGQAYLLTGDERYAAGVRDVLKQWFDANPYSHGVNFGVTMEVALRILTWTWFFHVFARSESWSVPEFRQRFLRTLFLHAVFTEKHLEKGDINGNHYTANAAGLVFAGLFFRRGKDAQRWLNAGWRILCDELPRQVFTDGVDFEASVAYHRLVLELFLLPALYRMRAGLDVSPQYRDRIAKMASFTAAYSRPDGTSPLWGDADDGRALPFGAQQLNDHRYLLGLVGCTCAPELTAYFSGRREEIFWLLGPGAAESLPQLETPKRQPGSTAFGDGGFYVMRTERDHIFIDCGPLGLAGRGGHGHNDALSFEAVLDGVHLITDCGSFVYSADFTARNRFRSTAFHNTPVVNGDEINRFVAPNELWMLRNDATPELRHWETSPERDLFCGAHSGYRRLASPVTPVRTIELDKRTHTLTVVDEFEGRTEASIEVPLHLAPGVEVLSCTPPGRVLLRAQQRKFEVIWEQRDDWKLSVEDARVSSSYGLAVNSKYLVWRRGKRSANRLFVSVSAMWGVR